MEDQLKIIPKIGDLSKNKSLIIMYLKYKAHQIVMELLLSKILINK